MPHQFSRSSASWFGLDHACMRAFHSWHGRFPWGLPVVGSVAFVLSLTGVISTEHRSLPLEWKHFVALATTLALEAYLLLRTLGRAVARFWRPPVVAGTATNLVEAEALDGEPRIFSDKQGALYRYRYAQAGDIEVFCRLAMSDPAIVTTYSYLGEREWKQLYNRWFEADAHNLMVLESLELSKKPSGIAAASIVIPLASKAARSLWTGAIGTVDLAKAHIASSKQRPDVLLLDLVVADRRMRLRCPELVFGLPKLHLARQGSPWVQRCVEVWIEPVHRALPKILEQIGFEGPHKTTKGHIFYKLTLPPKIRHMSELQRKKSLRLQQDIKECATWPISD